MVARGRVHFRTWQAAILVVGTRLMPDHGRMTGRRPMWLFAFIAIAALTCAGLATLISTDSWAAWFHHPAQNRPELTREGAVLWRAMLATSAVMMALATVVVHVVQPRVATCEIERGIVSRRTRLLTLSAIVVAGLVFRATRIHESLWYDEIASWMTYTGGVDSAGAIVGSFLDPINQVAHTLLNWISVHLFVSHLGVEPAFRVPALLFSLLSVIAMFGLGRAALDERIGFIAAGLIAVLPVSVLEGVEARGYSMMICLAAAMTWALLEAHRRHQPWIWVVYALLCALGIWSHFVTAFVPIGHAAWLIWRAARHKEWRFAACGLAALALAATFTITLYAPMIPSMLAAREMFARRTVDQPTILGAEGWHALLQLGGSWYWWAALPGLALLPLGLRRAFKSINGRNVVMMTMLGLLMMLIIVAASRSWVYARFTLFALPGAVLVMALAIDRLWRWRPAIGAIAILLVVIASIADVAVRPPKQPLRDAADFVRSRWAAGDSVVALGLAHPVLAVYAADLNLSYSFWFGADLEMRLDANQPRWVIVEYPRRVKVETYALLHARGYRAIQQFRGWADWTEGDVIVMQKTNEP